MELSFSSLRCKDVINVCDGKNLGPPTDIIIDACCARIIGIIVPYSKSFLSIFKSTNDIFIPYNRICKIGTDIILVDIIMQNGCINETHNQTCVCNTDIKDNNFNQSKLNISNIVSNNQDWQ